MNITQICEGLYRINNRIKTNYLFDTRIIFLMLVFHLWSLAIIHKTGFSGNRTPH
jgi:hypothetical protein